MKVWIRRIHGKHGCYSISIPQPVAAELLKVSPFLRFEAGEGRLVAKPVEKEEVQGLVRELGPRALWTRGVYKLIPHRGPRGGVVYRVTLPAPVVKKWGVRFVKLGAAESGGFVVEPASEEEVERTLALEAVTSMTMVLREWVKRKGEFTWGDVERELVEGMGYGRERVSSALKYLARSGEVREEEGGKWIAEGGG
jgi:hypothetical protein